MTFMQAVDATANTTTERSRSRLASTCDLERKQLLGQFLTSDHIADFMASLFEACPAEIRLLDAGAGKGALTAAFVRRFCVRSPQPRRISVVAYELDEAIVVELEESLRSCEHECRASGIEFSAKVQRGDFVEAAVALTRHDLFGTSQATFDAAILNPPYRKISSDSRTRRLLREAGIETSNLYTGFLALAARLLRNQGEMVTICPRSFCNGPYFRPFREEFLGIMSLRRLHVFESRSAAFRHDRVLQENVIIHALKSPEKPASVVISSCSGKEGGSIVQRTCTYAEVVAPHDADQFIHILTRDTDDAVRRRMAQFTTPLAKLGLEVSTGRVVDFRSRQFLVHETENGSVPLIYPCDFNGWFVQWPRSRGRKPTSIRETDRTGELLVPAAIYVLVKRFTSKEERRRVVACIYDPRRIVAERVGFENHLDYFHARGRGLPMDLAKGLAAFLNSTLVDIYFRQFNGHTQVNATDLRSMRYPTFAQLESLGRKVGENFPSQAELDALVERELL